MKTVVIDHQRIERILTRIAYQLIEQCDGEEHILLIGIKPRGQWVAKQLQKSLEGMNDKRFTEIELDLKDEASIAKTEQAADNQCVVLADDILNTGRTMMQAATIIMQANAKRIITVCLVDRKHRNFPIKSDFTGLSLATTIQEHLVLDISDEPQIYLE